MCDFCKRIPIGKAVLLILIISMIGWFLIGKAVFSQTLTSDSAAQAIAIAGGGGGGTPEGTIRQRLTTTPTVIPPAIQGANPCNIGASGGGSFMGWGASAAVLGESRRCRGQEWFRFQMMAGNREAAIAVACVTDEDMREAYRLIGQPCPQDRGAVAASPPPAMVVATPVPSPSVAAPARPDWCLTASPAERRRRPECGS